LDYDDREALLDDLFLGFDLDDGDYDNDAAGLCARLGLVGASEDDDELLDPTTRKARSLAMAHDYLDALKPPDADDGGESDEAEPSEPSTQAQGPPH
jgi:hypothetical protein